MFRCFLKFVCEVKTICIPKLLVKNRLCFIFCASLLITKNCVFGVFLCVFFTFFTVRQDRRDRAMTAKTRMIYDLAEFYRDWGAGKFSASFVRHRKPPGKLYCVSLNRVLSANLSENGYGGGRFSFRFSMLFIFLEYNSLHVSKPDWRDPVYEFRLKKQSKKTKHNDRAEIGSSSVGVILPLFSIFKNVNNKKMSYE